MRLRSPILLSVDPSADDEEKIVAAVRMITTAYSAGDRVALADAGDPTPESARGARECRDRLSLPDTVADRTLHPSADDAPRPRPDRFAVIILGCTARLIDPGSLAEWAPLLTPVGTLIVLTHSNQQRGSRSTHSSALHRAAAMAGLALTDRLISAAPSVSPVDPQLAEPLRQENRWRILHERRADPGQTRTRRSASTCRPHLPSGSL